MDTTSSMPVLNLKFLFSMFSSFLALYKLLYLASPVWLQVIVGEVEGTDNFLKSVPAHHL